jgi:hypothetical protein
MKIEKYMNDFYNKNIKNREFVIIIILVFFLALGRQIFTILRFFIVWFLIYLICMRITEDNMKSLITATLLTAILYVLGTLYAPINIFEGFEEKKVEEMPMDKNELNDEITKLLGLKELSGEKDRADDDVSSVDGGEVGDADSDFDNVSDASSDDLGEVEMKVNGKKSKKSIMSKKRVQRETFALMNQIQNTLKDLAPQIKNGQKLIKEFDKLKLDDINLPEMSNGVLQIGK